MKTITRSGGIFFALACLLASLFSAVQFVPGTTRSADSPMGWNSWNKFGCKVSEDLLKSTADGMISSGMKDAGYEYVVIDDCWQVSRDADGNIVPDAKNFPAGMKALGDYIHSKGLKFGIYSDAGEKTCAGRPGSLGHEYQDAIMYAKWGVDYLKYDWCHTGKRNAEEAYSTMRDALKATGRPIVSACANGELQNRGFGCGHRKSVAHDWRYCGFVEGRRKWPDGKLLPTGNAGHSGFASRTGFLRRARVIERSGHAGSG